MKISVIGAGAMGGSIVKGLLKGTIIRSQDVTVADPRESAVDEFVASGVSLTSDNSVAASAGDVVFVVVKPWIVEKVLREIRPSLDPKRQAVVVVAAGVSLSKIKEWIEDEEGKVPPTFLAIPNIAIAQLCSMTFIVDGGASSEWRRTIKELFEDMGEAMFTEERLLPAATSLASCGIAYALRYIRAASEGGVELGFGANDSKKIVMQTVKGAVSVLEASGAHPEEAIDRVTTPGGVTIKGLNEMEHSGFTSSVIKGLKAGAK